MKVFLGIIEIAGHYEKLKDGFASMGVECIFVDLFNHPFKYKNSECISILIRTRNLILRNVTGRNTNFVLKYWWYGWWVALNILLFCYALIKYDVFIFGFISASLWYRGLPILKYLNKKIICRFHGADLRPPYLSGSFAADADQFNVAECIRLAAEKKEMARKIEKYADVIISNPLLSQFLERPFVAATMVGIPSDIKGEQIIKTNSDCNSFTKKKIRVVHAPSHPVAKGTNKIRDIISTLKKVGHPLEYIEIKGKPNHVVLNELSRCDFAIDQLYSDTPMAGFSAEAATFCKPAVVGGYAKKQFDKIYSPGRMPPSVYSHPNNVEDAIVRLIEDKNYRLELGRKAKEFVSGSWSARKVAERYVKIIKNELPEDWWYYPNEIEYCHGSCLSEERAKEVIRSVIETGGKRALQLSDKPKLESKFLDFAYSEVKDRERDSSV
jgi:hypothetical protein